MDDEEYDFLQNAQDHFFPNAQDPADSSPRESLENYDGLDDEDDVLPNAQRRFSGDITGTQQSSDPSDSYLPSSTNSVRPDPPSYSSDSMFLLPPSKDAVLSSLDMFGFSSVRYPLPRFSLEKDHPDKLVNIRTNTIESIDNYPGLPYLEEVREKMIARTFGQLSRRKDQLNLENFTSQKLTRVQTIARPPTRAQVEEWIKVRAALRRVRRKATEKPKRVAQKLLIRENSDDSEGSEMSCSPPSSPDDNLPSAQSLPLSLASSVSLPEMSRSQSLNPSKSPEWQETGPTELSCEKAESPDLFEYSTTEDRSQSLLENSATDINLELSLGSEESTGSLSPILSRRPPNNKDEDTSSGDDEIGESPIISKSQRTARTSQPLNFSSYFLDTSENTTPELNRPRKLSGDILDKSRNSSGERSRHFSGDICSKSKDFPHDRSRHCSGDIFDKSRNSSGDKSSSSSCDIFDKTETPERSRNPSDDMFADNEATTPQLDQTGPGDGAKKDLNEATPILKRGSSKPILKRRISWNLPDNPDSQKTANSRNVQDQSWLETQNSTAGFSRSIMAKLDDSQAIKKFLTPENVKRSKSMVESPTEAATPRPLVDLKNTAGAEKKDHLTMLLLELFVKTRAHHIPDPLIDPIEAVFYSVVRWDSTLSGCICVSPGKVDIFRRTGITGLSVRWVETELDLLRTVVRLVRDSDPDILAGYEIQLESWGLLFQRAFHLGLNLCPVISRIPDSIRESTMTVDSDNPGAVYNADHTSEINLVGRVVFNTWRILRSELAMTSYTLENVAMKVLSKRIPKISHQTLSTWWNKDTTRHKAIHHLVNRNNVHLEILSRLDLLSRTAELARLFGIQFSEVLSRGSQFRVESSMLRLAKPRNFLPVSPTRPQLASQAAPEYLALLLEPESRLYTDPVVVLDFQSLYPSIIIAYNYCYSTCLGRIQNMADSDSYIFGCTQLETSSARLTALRDHITISPGGIAFVKPSIRKGVLPHMLEDILNTRIMVKQSMKKHKDPDLQKILHSRQLGLKLIANVTYGYTSANFSGRMPCIEVGDSVVAKGREALELAIKTIEERKDWGGRVVYGDTDSVFVVLKGKTKDEAFDIGEEMARVITQQNPKPMKLKFEKVYLPCILQTKKRYVGYMYESKSQLKPVFDAKGIETVRRDGIPATAKLLEKAIRIIFETNDVSQVKSYVQSQFKKIISGDLSLQDLTFAKEFRGFNGYRPTACVPALELTKLAMRRDRRLVPRTGERVPYVVVYGEPGLPLIQLVREPMELLNNSNLRPNSHYYITKVIIPPLNRCFLLLGVDTGNWYAELPRVNKPIKNNTNKKGVISKYFVTQSCMACGKFSVMSVCEWCRRVPDITALHINRKAVELQTNIEGRLRECVKCAGEGGRDCVSLDCPNLYRRIAAINSKDDIKPLLELLDAMNLST